MLTATADNESALRERRCIASGEVLPESDLVRFVVSPDGEAVPDLDAKLPGRGIWLSADAKAFAKAIAKNDFSKAAKAKVSVRPDLLDHVARLLTARLMSDIGLARRAGLLDAGFDQVVKALDKKIAPVLFLVAEDAAEDGRRKIQNALYARGLEGETIGILSRHELSLALGRENVVHAAIRPSALAERLISNARKLARLKASASAPPSNTKGGPSAQNESSL